MASLSVCAIAYNEAALIGGMLESVDDLADEVILGVDSRTVDETCEIADRYGVKGFAFDWRDDFAYARNLTLDRAQGDWILVLDADERLLPAGKQAIRDVLESASPVPAPDAVTGISFMLGHYDLDETLHVIQRSSARLFRNRPEIRYVGIVHEEVFWNGDRAQTSVLLVTGEAHIAHYGYDPTLWKERGKYERNLRLLEMRLKADPNDAHAAQKLHDLRVAQAAL